jgi:uncharacterized membrane protein YgcG
MGIIMRRLLRHLLYFPWRLRQIFDKDVLAAIEREIAASEQRHSGQIRFAVEANLDLMQLLRGVASRARALELFAQLRVWDTELNNGVLIYLLLAEHRVEIVADRGFNAKLEPAVWHDICQRLQERLHQGEYEAGICACIREVDGQITAHFADTRGGVNELPDRPVVL